MDELITIRKMQEADYIPVFFENRPKEHSLDIVEALAKRAYEKSCCGDWSALDDIKQLEKAEYIGPWIYQCCLETVLFNLKGCMTKTEQDVYEWFRDNYKNALGNDYEISNRKSERKHKPDFWLERENQYIPVECKLNAFTSKSLEQLQRYMKHYGASFGIAVGSECDIELPDNVIFVKHEI